MNDLHGMTTVLTFLALTALAAIIYSKTQFSWPRRIDIG